MKKLLCFLGGALLLSNIASAQYSWQKYESGKIYIDSRLPDLVLGKFIRYKDTTAKLSDFSNKIIVLDFWFTHCSDCIAQFPKEDSLQKAFGDDIQIIPVAYESKKVISNFLNKWEQSHHTKLSMPFIVEDTLLNKCFANNYFPHYVWLSQDRRIIGETSQYFFSEENIKSVVRQTQYIKNTLLKNNKLLDEIPSMNAKDLYNYQFN